ncbi:MAG: Chaperone protein DnaK [Candidatus Magasanikbacteria bacterium GW2011_GWA2_42_32]|uniref:Chaperone protein DnaK n=1 Tax=Candidatus Magasanikbacteria bacterium GW2011_GWA2_42_32 TaxID=1619039 RepID=A0A0G0ZY74_9BACT|nr:MAG: Chaperone protein DnaK [Candidatus Magasanikbacteria bacterium GW2011_GWA2_42_32]
MLMVLTKKSIKKFDQVIMQWILSEFKKDQGIDLSKDNLALQRIKEAAEKAKIELSTAQETEINQPFITSGSDGPKHLVMKMTRAKLEQLVGELVEKTIAPVKNALKDAKMSTSDINEVVMVGGMTRMPLVYQTVEKFFGKKPNITVNPDEVVAVGAAVQGAILRGEVKDVFPQPQTAKPVWRYMFYRENGQWQLIIRPSADLSFPAFHRLLGVFHRLR